MQLPAATFRAIDTTHLEAGTTLCRQLTRARTRSDCRSRGGSFSGSTCSAASAMAPPGLCRCPRCSGYCPCASEAGWSACTDGRGGGGESGGGGRNQMARQRAEPRIASRRTDVPIGDAPQATGPREKAAAARTNWTRSVGAACRPAGASTRLPVGPYGSESRPGSCRSPSESRRPEQPSNPALWGFHGLPRPCQEVRTRAKVVGLRGGCCLPSISGGRGPTAAARRRSTLAQLKRGLRFDIRARGTPALSSANASTHGLAHAAAVSVHSVVSTGA